MYHIQTLNKISAAGLKRFDPEHYQVSDSQTNPEGIMVRSAKLLDMDFPSELLAIARAGVGVGERMKRIERSSSRKSGAPPPVFLRSASRLRIESCTRERRSVLFRSM